MNKEGIYIRGDSGSGWRLVAIDINGMELTTLAGPCMTLEDLLRTAMLASGEPVLIRVG